MRLVEMGGSHTIQETYDSLDVHVGQSLAVLVTFNQRARDYFIVASSRFTSPVLTSTGYIKYSNSKVKASGALPVGPTTHVPWSMKQARSFRCNLTASAARPNPQGTYHYGSVKIMKTIRLSNSEAKINGKLRYAINGMSYINPDTPLKLADWFNIPGVFDLKSFSKKTSIGVPAKFGTPVIGALLHDFVEIIFSNTEDTIQSWYLAGNDFWVVGYGPLKWSAAQRKHYNLVDAPKSYTIQVYPKSWTAILLPLDNKGMWNLRSQIWPRRYLGQELYVKVWNDETSLYTEYNPPPNTLFCGKARGKHV